MKKILIFTIVTLNVAVKSNSQITKKTWHVGGSGSFSSTKYDFVTGSNQKITEIDFNSNIGFFVIDKFSIGLKPGVNYRESDLQNSGYSQTFLRIGPFARYYFLSKEKAVNLLSEITYQFISSSKSAEENRFSVQAGPVIYFNMAVGLEFLLGYSTSKYSDDGGTSSSVTFSIGFQFHLEKQK